MKDWSGKEIESNGGNGVDHKAVDAEVRARKEEMKAQATGSAQYPICPDCGQRHPLVGGPENMGKFITLQLIKMSHSRSDEAAKTVVRETGNDNPIMADVFDRYIELFVPPEQRDAFLEGLCVGLGSGEAQNRKQQEKIEVIRGLVSLVNIALEG